MAPDTVTLICNLVAKLEFGHVLVFSGKSTASASSIYVNVDTPKQTAIRCLFDFAHNQLIRCIRKDKEWINEETKQNMEPAAPSIPKHGEKFKIALFCDEDKYRIWVQDKPYCHYDYFIPIKEVTKVELGSSGLKEVSQADHRRIFPSPWPLIQYDEDDLDFSHEIAAPFKINQQMVITGWTIGKHDGGFILFLRNGQNGQKSLSFRVCFNKKQIIRTAMKDPCSDGPAYTDGPFPFKFGERFKIAIGFLKNRFIFGVNGKRIPDFKYTEKDTLDNLASIKIWGRGDSHVIIEKVWHSQLTKEDCLDFNFEDICFPKPKADKLDKVFERGDTGVEDDNDDDDDCIDDSEYDSGSSFPELIINERAM